MEGGVKWFLPTLLAASLYACGSDAPPLGDAVAQRDSAAVMVTHGVSKLISDSGYVRYKIIAEEWYVYDRTKPPRHYFPKGIYLERYDKDFRVNLYITADTAYWYNQALWELRGNVFVRNFENGTTFSTNELFWDTNKHRLYSNQHIHVVTPDREIEGNWFESNEQMTEYHVKRTSGFMPMPREAGEAPEPAPSAEPDTLLAPPPRQPIVGPRPRTNEPSEN